MAGSGSQLSVARWPNQFIVVVVLFDIFCAPDGDSNSTGHVKCVCCYCVLMIALQIEVEGETTGSEIQDSVIKNGSSRKCFSRVGGLIRKTLVLEKEREKNNTQKFYAPLCFTGGRSVLLSAK